MQTTKISLITEYSHIYIRLRSGASKIKLEELVSLTMDEQGNIIGFVKKLKDTYGNDK